ncbi:ComEC/Rec2 family competence protein [Rubripirellula tenax]|nr:ComEC/Rec2 family competence protein [Rubripirellula tenax]
MFWMVIILSCVVSIFVCARLGRSVTSAVALAIAVFGLGGLNHAIQMRSYAESTIAKMMGPQSRPTIVEGVIERPAVLRRHPMAERRSFENQSPWQTQFEVTLDRVRVGYDFEPIDGRVLVSVDGRLDEFLPGDPIRVFGDIRGIAPPTNPGQTDMAGYYHRRRLQGRIDVNQIEQVQRIGEPVSGYGFSRLIAQAAARSRDGLLDNLSESAGPLAVALVIGQRDFVDQETRDQLLVTGTAHLLSVSGMHLAIVVLMTQWIAMILRMPMTAKIGLIIVVCIFYCAITGARPPVMRAAVLVSTLMFSIWMRRPGQAINTLSLAGLILVLANPQNVFSVGVQLSFLAVATLIMTSGRGRTGSPAIDQAIRNEEQLSELAKSARPMAIKQLGYGVDIIRQLLWFSLCVSVISLPLVWHQFNVISWISVPTNVVLGPLLVLALASGICTAGGVLLGAPLLAVPATVCEFSLAVMRWLIQWAADVPWGHAWLPAPPTWWVILFYIVIGLSLCYPDGPRVRTWRYRWMVVWVAIAWLMATWQPRLDRETLEATFVDVGHGTSVVIRSGDGDVWLYDCGRLGNDVGSSRGIDEAIWSLGVTRLNGVFLSHADSDHFNALPGLLRRFRVDQICTPPGMMAEPEVALDPIRDSVQRYRVPVHELSRGDEVTLGRSTMRVLHPPTIRLPASDNANSLVVRIDRHDKVLLLPGDLEPPGTDVLVNQIRPAPGGVLMAPHHGSLQMDAPKVLQWCRPAETIVSGGQRADRPEVTDMLGEFGSGVHVTAHDGAIRVRIDGSGQVEIRSWLVSPW